jgi:DNA-binding NarL/FixJ family response regulator
MLVMVAEDDRLHRAFARGIIENLWPGVVEVIEAADGNSAMTLSAQRSPPFVVLDLQLPLAAGIDVARALWRQRADTHILFWSNFADESYVRGVERIVPPGSVYGYVLKSMSEGGMRSALLGVFSEGRCIIDREVRGIQHRVQDHLEGLTDIEYESLVDLALGLTDRAIAERRGLSTRGAQARIKHIYEKLGLAAEAGSSFNSRTRAVYLALARGMINVDELRREEAQLIHTRANSGPGTQHR